MQGGLQCKWTRFVILVCVTSATVQLAGVEYVPRAYQQLYQEVPMAGDRALKLNEVIGLKFNSIRNVTELELRQNRDHVI